MQISEEQMRRLSEAVSRTFELRLATALRELLPHHAGELDDATWRIRTRQCVVAARAHHLTWELSIARYAGMMMVLGPGFDRQASFAKALAMFLPDEFERIESVQQNTTDEDWLEAGAIADPAAWDDLRLSRSA